MSEFHASKPASGPETTKGHQPGAIVSEADAAPEFHAETLPAGTAPPESTFKPNPDPSVEVPAATAETQSSEAGTSTKAGDTLTGADSGEVHKPVSGES